MVLILEIVVASIAVVLIMLSVKTLQTIRHLGIGKSFWTPVAVSGFLFFFGSMLAILFDLNYTLTAYTEEVVQISRLLALSTLAVGVYSYSRKISMNLAQTVTLPPQTAARSDADEMEAPLVSRAPARASASATAPEPEPEPVPIQERLSVIQENLRREAVQECGHKFGYLRTLPRDASIPDECLSCDKIIECKHSVKRTIETPTNPPPEA